MFNRYTTAVAAAALVSVASPAYAQSVPVAPNRDADGKALILIPLTLTKIKDLSFGTIIPSSLSGTVAVNATSGARSFTGGVSGVTTAAGQRATFAGAGTPNQQVIITYTTPTDLTSTTNSADTIPVLALTLEGSAVKSVDPVSRTFTFGIGGILQINGDQPEGVYQSTFNVNANYQ